MCSPIHNVQPIQQSLKSDCQRDVVQTVLLISTASVQEVLAASSAARRSWFRCDEGKHPERKAVIQKLEPPDRLVRRTCAQICATMSDGWPPWETSRPAAPVCALMSAEETCQRKQARLWWTCDPSAGSGSLVPSYSSTICGYKKKSNSEKIVCKMIEWY